MDALFEALSTYSEKYRISVEMFNGGLFQVDISGNQYGSRYSTNRSERLSIVLIDALAFLRASENGQHK